MHYSNILASISTPLAQLLTAPTANFLGVPKASDHPAWQQADQVTTAAIVQQATWNLNTPWPTPLLTDYRRFWQDGERQKHQDAYSGLRERTGKAAIAYGVTGQDVFLADAANGIALLLQMPTWCWSAHEQFAAARGEVVPDQSRPYLDLGACETVSELAWLDYLLGDQLDAKFPGLRRWLRHEVEQRGIGPFLSDYPWDWIGGQGQPVNNWNPWICSQILIAALLLEPDAERRAAVAEVAMRRLDIYLASLPADGGIDEGFAYWWQGLGRLLEGARALAEVSNGVLTLAGNPAVRAAAHYPVLMSWRDYAGKPGTRDWFVNPADGSARPELVLPWEIPYHWALSVGDDALATAVAQFRNPSAPLVEVRDSQGLGRALVAMFDAEFVNLPSIPAEPAGSTTQSKAAVFPDTQFAVAHSPSGLAYAIKGGHNDENHNHLDIGAVAIALDGIPYIIDLGAPTYTADTFSARRYELWLLQTGWHSAPTPWGHEQQVGRQYAGQKWQTDSDANGLLTTSVDIAAAYGIGGLSSWVRRISFSDDGHTIVLTDDATVAPKATAAVDSSAPLESADPLMTVRFILAGTVQFSDGGILVGGAEDPARVPAQDVSGPWPPIPPRHDDFPPRKLLLRWDDAEVAATLEHREITDPRLARVWGGQITRLTLRAAGNSLTVRAHAQTG